ncbi:MAG: hypothetical protein HOP23_18380 [Methylococcaceae bacterium]|nr:hypothetical protein [Methylococcaceae bacterium]
MAKTTRLFNLLVLGMGLLFSGSTLSAESEDSITTCLNSWGQHPFGPNPNYKTLSTSVNVFGIGDDPSDSEVTDSPSLVMVNPGVNVMGGTTIELLNPNGWYCLRSNVNVMGGMTIRLHCKAHLASATEGTTVMGSSSSNQKSVTVMGSTQVEKTGCE